MVQLTKLNGTAMVLNSDLIKTAEAAPDTMLTLINGEKLIVRESIDEVVAAVLTYRARLLGTVAQRMPDLNLLAPTAALTSLDLSGRNDQNSKGRPAFSSRSAS